MAQRRTLYQFHRSTFIEPLLAFLSKVRTTDENGRPIGMNADEALRFVDCIEHAQRRLCQEYRDRIRVSDAGTIEVSEDLIDRLLTARTNDGEKG